MAFRFIHPVQSIKCFVIPNDENDEKKLKNCLISITSKNSQATFYQQIKTFNFSLAIGGNLVTLSGSWLHQIIPPSSSLTRNPALFNAHVRV